MTKASILCAGFTPFWNTDVFGMTILLGTIGAGVTLQTAVPHPYAGAAGERYVKLDMNHADHQTGLMGAGNTATGEATLTGEVRWCLRHEVVCQFRNSPTADAIIWSSSLVPSGSIQDRILRWVANSRFLELQIGFTKIRSAVEVPDSTDIILQFFEVSHASNGLLRYQNQIVLRYLDISTLAPTMLINAVVPVTNTSPIGGVYFGEQTARGGGEFYFGTLYQAIENADDLYGRIRHDWMKPNANGHIAEWSDSSAAGADVDETPNSVPDGDGSVDAHNFALANTTKKLAFGLTAPNYVTTGDTVIRVASNTKGKVSGTLDKGAVPTLDTFLSNGSTDVVEPGALAFVSSPSGYGQTYSNGLPNVPGGSGWAPSDLTNLQAGMRATSTTTGAAVTISSTVLVSQITYIESGEETIDPVPPAPDQSSVLLFAGAGAMA